MPNLQGVYEGDGSNVSGALAKAPPGDVPATNSLSAVGPQGNQQSVAIDRRRRLRVSDEAARSGTAINVGSGDQILTKATRWVWISATATLVVRLVDDTADITLASMPVGLYPMAIAIVRQSGTSGSGVLLF